MREVRIEARVDADSGWVELEPPQARVPEGATVIWTFINVPPDLRPALLLESFIPEANAGAGPAAPSNPFGRTSRRGDEIHGSDFGGLAGESMYTIGLLAVNGDGTLVRRLQCRNAPAGGGGLVRDPGPRAKQG